MSYLVNKNKSTIVNDLFGDDSTDKWKPLKGQFFHDTTTMSTKHHRTETNKKDPVTHLVKANVLKFMSNLFVSMSLCLSVSLSLSLSLSLSAFNKLSYQHFPKRQLF